MKTKICIHLVGAGKLLLYHYKTIVSYFILSIQEQKVLKTEELSKKRREIRELNLEDHQKGMKKERQLVVSQMSSME